jgi:AcrR family transcriptional regulator
LLLRTAQEVFVRDGYAGAELEEIAALAGRTKGATYAQFKSIEDIFMELVEQHALHHRAEIAKVRVYTTSVEQNREEFLKFFMKLSSDKLWNILMLEFKLFGIRNPEAKKRYQAFIAKTITSDDETRLNAILDPKTKGKTPSNAPLAVQMMQSLLSALTLETVFDPEIFNEDVSKKITRRIFEVLLETKAKISS